MNRCKGINSKKKYCRRKIEDRSKFFCCENHMPINKNLYDEECFMCGSFFSQKDTWVLKCGHGFHKECLEDWFNHSTTNYGEKECPICRRIHDKKPQKQYKHKNISGLYEYTSEILENIKFTYADAVALKKQSQSLSESDASSSGWDAIPPPSSDGL